MDGLDPRRADIAVAGSVLLDASCGASARTTSRCAISRCAKGSSSTTSIATPRTIRKIEHYPDVRRRSVVELGERCGYWSAHARHVAQLALSVFDQTRAVAQARRSRAGVAGIRRAAARRRRAHQLRAAPSPFVLPDQERRAARLRSAGDRDHRAPGALSSSGDAEEDPRRLRAAERARCGGRSGRSPRCCGWPRGSIAATRRRGRRRRRAARRRLSDSPARGRRRGARALGRAPPRGGARRRARAPAAIRGRWDRTRRNGYPC